MNTPLVRVALAKADGAAERERLQPVEAAALRLDAIADGFEERIRANKARRGEAPTKLGKRQREEIAGYAKDADEMTGELLADLAGLTDARTVIRTLLPGIEHDAAFWRSAIKYAHEADRLLVEELVVAKEALRDAMRGYLDVDEIAH